jgi:uncharacterized protein (TIGR02996 family)
MAERDREALLAAVRSEPDDDLPRLALADWLDEHGGDGERAWARLIRVQCEHARRAERLAEAGATEEIIRLNTEGERIIREHRKTLLAGLPVGGGFALYYRRGMPEYAVARTGRDFLKRAERAFAAAPIQTVRISQITRDDMDSIAVSVWLTLIRGLELLVWADDDTVADIARTAGLADVRGMRSLEIYHYPQWASNPDAIVAALAGGRRWTGLRRLVLHTGGLLSPGPLRDLSRAARLHDLTLGPCLTALGIRDITTRFPELRSLKLCGNGLTDEDAEALAGSKQLARLRHLNLTDRMTELSDPSALVRLLTSPSLADLTSVRLFGGNRPVGDLSAVRPRKAVRPATLRVLQLPYFRLSAASVAALVRIPSLQGLTWLDLTGNQIGRDGVTALGAAPWQRLTRLDLRACQLDNRDVATLAGSPGLAGLVHLNLNSNPLGVDAARAIARSPHLGGLRHLSLPPSTMKGEAGKELKRRFGRKGWSGATFSRPE